MKSIRPNLTFTTMMKKYILLPLLAVCLYACKKTGTDSPGQPEKSGSKQINALTFKVSGFTVSDQLITNGINKKTLATSDQVKFLHYLVYKGKINDVDVGEKPYHEIIQSSTDADFGSFKDSIPNGNYQILVLGTQTLGTITADYRDATGSQGRVDPLWTFNTPLKECTFYARLDTTIVGPISKNIVLNRVVGKVTINVNDPIPSNASKMVLNIENYPPGFSLFDGTGREHGHETDPYASAVFTFPLTTSDIGKQNYQVSAVVWPFYYWGIILECLDKNGNVLATKTMPKTLYDIYTPIKANTQYFYSGSLFGNSGAFNVSVNGDWDSSVNTPFSLSFIKGHQ
ncbi:hypothetical protein [Mucilaginibacter agri]|uniref:DUF4382 domain-containing protein n=1 Tax=Mucilaginibacter agri TaxID=2695265 RepID=A0A965ZDX6_9SPHI|nr:hypothetical protein [Mucilaginibacter agri]NCD67996.1 hypothetical protein [Mucilaginibacter agri]